jgi:hypothetical protein
MLRLGLVQDRADINLAAGTGVEPRVDGMDTRLLDYRFFVNGRQWARRPPAGYRLINVELQADKYATGLPAGLNPPVDPLPFIYMSTGVETRFVNGLDPDPKTRAISANLPHIHRPHTLAEWIGAETLGAWVKRLHAEGGGFYTAADDTRPAAPRTPDAAAVGRAGSTRTRSRRSQAWALVQAQPPASADPDGDGQGRSHRSSANQYVARGACCSSWTAATGEQAEKGVPGLSA